MKNKLTIGIIGYGRFGKLWASCLASIGTVSVYDKKRLPQKLPPHVKPASLVQVTSADILFLLVPISQMESCCVQIAPLLKKDTIVVDACSVKLYPVKIMKKILAYNQTLIATHPLFGPDSNKNGIKGKKIVVSMLRASDKQRGLIESMLKTLGLIVIHATPRQHDKAMAKSQALVHLVGRGLEPLHLKQQLISTPDYESLLTMQAMVQNDSWQLFFDMQNYNPYTKVIRKKIINQLLILEKQIASHV